MFGEIYNLNTWNFWSKLLKNHTLTRRDPNGPLRTIWLSSRKNYQNAMFYKKTSKVTNKEEFMGNFLSYVATFCDDCNFLRRSIFCLIFRFRMLGKYDLEVVESYKKIEFFHWFFWHFYNIRKLTFSPKNVHFLDIPGLNAIKHNKQQIN